MTIVASMSGTKPSSTDAPFIIGTPAIIVLSFTAMRLPASLPPVAPRMSVRTYQAFSGLSAGSGR
ncbi:MAG: hypothetical protein LT102_13240 [Burkholderiaceae bacterium]|nr:hypothetical protein [Burkholderiaceae bacterium]